jgi:hypothetical protein
MSYEKRVKLYFKKYIKEHLLFKLKNYLDNHELSKEGLSREERELL